MSIRPADEDQNFKHRPQFFFITYTIKSPWIDNLGTIIQIFVLVVITKFARRQSELVHAKHALKKFGSKVKINIFVFVMLFEVFSAKILS